MARPIPVTEWSKIPAETAAYYSYVATPHASVAHPVGGTAQEVFQAVAQALTGVPQQEAVEEKQVQPPQAASVAEGGTGQDGPSLTSTALETVTEDPPALGSGQAPVQVDSPLQSAAGTGSASVGTGPFAQDQVLGAGLFPKSHPVSVSVEQDGSGPKAGTSVESRPLHGLSKEHQVVQVDKDLARGARKQRPLSERINAKGGNAQAHAGNDLIKAFQPPDLHKRKPFKPFLAGGAVHHPY